ncbi:MAG: hypothetical protein JWR80_3633 [Bradyrhizobium sp.]|nr:hypothetical protein [Bradyrhizobium sp.]
MTRLRYVLAGLALLAMVGGLVISYLLSHPSMAQYANLTAQPASGTGGLTVRYLGTATLSFKDDKTTIMIDGFLSRPSPWRVLFTRIASDEPLIGKALDRADVQDIAALFVAHSHYDHAMDTAAVANRNEKKTMVYGSQSTANVVLGSGVEPDRIRVFAHGDTFCVGKSFRVKVFETPHSPDALFDGTVDAPLPPRSRVWKYKMGGNYSFLIEHGNRRILVIPGGNYRLGTFEGVKADVVFLAIGTMGKQRPEFTQALWYEAVKTTGAKLVVPIHWDDFMIPLDQPLRPMPRGMDDFHNSMMQLLVLAQRDKVLLRLPQAFTAIDLDDRLAPTISDAKAPAAVSFPPVCIPAAAQSLPARGQ